MFLDHNSFVKILMAGLFNGIRIGRNLKYGRKKYLHRLQYNPKKRYSNSNKRIGSTYCIEEQYLPME